MKKLIIALMIFLPFLMTAQLEGIIQYEETIALNIELPEGMEEFASQIPNSKKSKMELIFTENAGLYQSAKNNDDSRDLTPLSEDEVGMVQMKFEMPENKTFTNIADGTMVEKQEIMGKKFLILGDAKKYKWKLTGEQKKISGYVCQKATFQDEEENLVAWFTSYIPVATGPGSVSGLPGMILKLDINAGEMVVVATNVELKKVEEKLIKAPKKGKKVTKEEFKKIQEEKMKEMKEKFGGQGNVIIQQF
ncbi:GLPGLI family protein [bacterium]|nr:GLPGLI family protein [bacterium]